MRKISINFDQDMIEIMEVIMEKLREKYINPFEEIIKSRNESLRENPTPEISLLNALKPFVDNKCCKIIDRLVSSYNIATLASIITEDLQQARASSGSINLQEVGSRATVPPKHRINRLSILIPLLILLIFNETH
ncbi:MAG: hypothetical protein QME73_06050 [Bacillota bacterium]|nr:hypothetical protein [Bacillota bacterium]